ncbi:MAG TPA: aldehyde dehydrogenase family protein [Puia sp.]
MPDIIHPIEGLFPDGATLPPEWNAGPSVYRDKILINGKLQSWKGPMQVVYSPVYIRAKQGLQQLALGRYPLTGEKEASEAMQTARAAYGCGIGEWPALSIRERASQVEQFAAMMDNCREEMIQLIILETGKPVMDAREEFYRATAYIHATVDAARRLNNRGLKLTTAENWIAQLKRIPLGVVLCAGAADAPLYGTITTLIPAVLMGNTVLVRPPRRGVLAFGSLLDGFAAAFPAGVINVVYGRDEEVLSSLMGKGGIDAAALIGAGGMADAIGKWHPKPRRFRTLLAMDAKNAAIVLPDADMELAVRESLQGALEFNGQWSTSLKLFFVHRSVADEFVNRMEEAMKQVKTGMPWEEGVTITPMMQLEGPARLQELIGDATCKGARLAGGESGQPYVFLSLMKPILLYPVDKSMRIFYEDQRGPVIPVVPFDDLRDVVGAITDSSYGQQASIFGKDPAVVGRLVDQLSPQLGRINLNARCAREPDTLPFTGRKDSAEGVMSVEETLLALSLDSVIACRKTAGGSATFEQILLENTSGRLSNLSGYDEDMEGK